MKNCTVATIIFTAYQVIASASGLAQDRQAQAAIAEIEALGGRIYRSQNQQVDSVSLTGSNVTDAHLPLLQALPTIRQLDLDGARVTDAGLEHLMQLPNLQEVSLRQTSVSSAAAEDFKQRHPGVYHVMVSPSFRPGMLAFAFVMAAPLGFGAWLIQAAIRKQEVLAPRHFARGISMGILLVIASAVMMLIALAQSLGSDINLANLFD